MDIIVDIDGTVADLTHRRHWVLNRPKNWKAFYANVENDAPILPVIELVQCLHRDMKNNVIFCSGREEIHRPKTVAWLRQHVFNPQNLYMRKKNDYRDDGIVKYELLQEIRADGFNPVAAIDDRKRVCQMWIENGLHLFDVGQGQGDF